MKWHRVAAGSFNNIEYETKESGGEFLHIVTSSGPLSRDERAPVYEETIKLTQSDNYFCILDNRKSKGNLVSMADMSYFGDLLLKKGIKRFFYAVVTHDPAYDNMIKLIKAVAVTKNLAIDAINLEIEAIATPDFEEAEAFILTHVKKFIDTAK